MERQSYNENKFSHNELEELSKGNCKEQNQKVACGSRVAELKRKLLLQNAKDLNFTKQEPPGKPEDTSLVKLESSQFRKGKAEERQIKWENVVRVVPKGGYKLCPTKDQIHALVRKIPSGIVEDNEDTILHLNFEKELGNHQKLHESLHSDLIKTDCMSVKDEIGIKGQNLSKDYFHQKRNSEKEEQMRNSSLSKAISYGSSHQDNTRSKMQLVNGSPRQDCRKICGKRCKCPKIKKSHEEIAYEFKKRDNLVGGEEQLCSSIKITRSWTHIVEYSSDGAPRFKEKPGRQNVTFSRPDKSYCPCGDGQFTSMEVYPTFGQGQELGQEFSRKGEHHGYFNAGALPLVRESPIEKEDSDATGGCFMPQNTTESDSPLLNRLLHTSIYNPLSWLYSRFTNSKALVSELTKKTN